MTSAVAAVVQIVLSPRNFVIVKSCSAVVMLSLAGNCFGEPKIAANGETAKGQTNGSCFKENSSRPARAPNGTEIAPLVTTAIERYEIRGESFEDLKREFAAKGRHGYAGSTMAEVTYRFKSQKGDGECRVTEVRASCDSRIKLPNWLNLPKAPAPMQARWKVAFDDLKKHEQGHVNICVEVAKEVERALWATPVGNDCYLVDLNARNRAAKIIATMNDLQTAYDQCEYGRRPQ